MPVKSIPEGYHSVTPYLILDDATRALEFYKKAFGAVELLRMPAPGGRIGHAEIKIGDSPIMLADENPEMGARSARTIGGSSISLMRRSRRLSPPARSSSGRSRTSSTATAPAASTIRSAITGTSPPTSRMSRRTSSRSARQKRWDRRGQTTFSSLTLLMRDFPKKRGLSP